MLGDSEGGPPILRTPTGWWFGCHFLFSPILGISSSQLTNSYFSEGWPWPTNQPNFGSFGFAKFLKRTTFSLQEPWPVQDGESWRPRQSCGACVAVSWGAWWGGQILWLRVGDFGHFKHPEVLKSKNSVQHLRVIRIDF